MIQTLLMISISSSVTFIFISHPLSMGLVLLIQTILIAMITGMMTQNFWFSYILFMIMVGGMLVLFIYMTSVASNEKFSFSNKLVTIMMWTVTIIMMMLIMEQFSSYIMTTNSDMMELTSESKFKNSLTKYLNIPSNMMMIMMIVYLLMALIAVVKITNITYGPLRQKI